MRFCLSILLLAGNLLKVLTMINLYHQTNSGFKGEDVGSKIKAVVLLLFIHCLLLLSLFVFFFFFWPLFCCAVLCILSSFAIISLGKRELIVLPFIVFLMSCGCYRSWCCRLVCSV